MRAGLEHPPPTLVPEFLRDGDITPCPCSILVRTELARRVGGFEARFRKPSVSNFSNPFSKWLQHKFQGEQYCPRARAAQQAFVLQNLYEDQVFYTKVCLTAAVLRLEACVARYRQHPRSLCAASRIDWSVARRIYLEWVREHLQATDNGDCAVWQALREEFCKLSPPFSYQIVALGKRGVRALVRRVLP